MSLTQTIGRPIRLCSIFDVDITVDVGFVGLLAVSFISVAIQSKDAALGLEYAALIALFFLVHEFGHALMAKRFTLKPAVHLSLLSGFCKHEGAQSPTQHALILVAGGGTGIIVGLLFYIGQLALVNNSSPATFNQYTDLMFKVMRWSIWLNLANLCLPIYSLDGGQLFDIAVRRCVQSETRASVIVHSVGFVLACAVALYGATYGQYFLAGIAFMLMVENAQHWNIAMTRSRPQPFVDQV
ncbi:unnamed protein product (mitochondrion) [Plasmodiophora brassicae]|uniref:Peptidase M50 domain-containing protein n=1 Tax=Plasmodiophora brassicae TaxID=37360 RepID=A0A0G4IIE5_PLABS|nr:hypothetical protein PBRA_003663 [Plasmodiophora brassicae]SPQ94184.1 unnamed protein product [Plasmodiophora brassicae]